MANNSKSLLNENKSIVRKKLGLCEHSEIYLKNIVMDLIVYKNIDLARKDMSNKLMVFKGNRKGEILLLGGKRSCLKRVRGYNTGEEEGGSRYYFAK